MKAMVLEAPGRPLRETELPDPKPGPGQVLLRISACGVCRTDLHVADGELPDPKLPLVLGHQIVGTVEALGEGVERGEGERLGVPRHGWTDGGCPTGRDRPPIPCEHPRCHGLYLDTRDA